MTLLCDADRLRHYLGADLEIDLQELLCDPDVIEEIEVELMDIYVTIFHSIEIVSRLLTADDYYNTKLRHLVNTLPLLVNTKYYS